MLSKQVKTILAGVLITFVIISVAFLVYDNVLSPDTGIDTDDAISLTNVSDKVIVYYFHTTGRCISCEVLESYTNETVHTYFQQDLDDGRLEWRSVDVEDVKNRHYIKDYNLAYKSIVIVKVVDGKQAEWKNLDEAWNLLGDKDAFTGYVRENVAGYLEAIK